MCYREVEGTRELTDFGKEILPDEIHWWVFRKEKDVQELLTRTEDTLRSAQNLKEDSFRFKEECYPESYSDLMGKIEQFAEIHAGEIQALYDYVAWLSKKDVLAPCILYTYRVWGSTRLTDLQFEVTQDTIDEDEETVKICTELAIGLRTRFGYTIWSVYSDIMSDMASSVDPEYQGSISVPQQTLLIRTSHRILDKLADYCELLRQSLRNIILEVKLYNAETELLCRESFWKPFITKAMAVSVENQLWDFKENLEMWGPKSEGRREAQLKFCEQVASFANAGGGAIIIGITDKLPRNVAGIQDLENKLKYTMEVLEAHIGRTDFIHLQPVVMKHEAGNDRDCLVVAIAQTKDVIVVKDASEQSLFPTRFQTGSHRSEYEKLRKSKVNIQYDNYGFILVLDRLLHDRPDSSD